MKSKSVNLWNVLAWLALALAASGVVWAGVTGPVAKDSDTNTAIPQQLGKDPAALRVLQLPAGTDQRGAYWRDIKTLPEGASPGDVPQVTTTGTNTGWGVTNITGTAGYLAKFGASGVTNSHIYEDSSWIYPTLGLNFGNTYGAPKLVLYDDGANVSGLGVFANETLRIFADTSYKVITFGKQSRAGVFTEYGRMLDGSLTLEGGLAVKALPGGGVGKILYQSSTDGTISAKTLTASDVGAEPTLSACAPGQGLVYTGAGTGTSTAKGCKTLTAADFLPTGTPGQVPTVSAVTATGAVTTTATRTTTGTATSGTYSFTATGTVTTTGTEIKMTNGTVGFDPDGTFFLAAFDPESPTYVPAYARRATLPSLIALGQANAPQTFSAACSTGSDGLIATFGEFFSGESWSEANRIVWPAGDWFAKLRAKVNANGAAIRIEVWDQVPEGSASYWFSWTTDSFANTSFATISKLTSADERWPSVSTNRIVFRLYATCSTSTTVSLELDDTAFSSRIESPIVYQRVAMEDVVGLNDTLYQLNLGVAGKEPTLPVGNVGQVLTLTGSGTGVGTSRVWTTLTGSSIAFGTSTPAIVGSTSGSAGTSTSASRSDHVHPCTAATTSANGCMASADKTKLNGLAALDHKVSVYDGSDFGYLNDVVFSYTGSVNVGINSSQSPTRLNLNTTFGTATPSATGTSGVVGTAASSSRSDHQHAEGTGPRTPTAHQATHIPGGSDALSVFATTPALNKVPVMSDATKGLADWIGDASATQAGRLNSPFFNLLNGASATPAASILVKSDASGTLNSWVSGRLVNTEEFTSSVDYWTTTGAGWFAGPSLTFTSLGMRLNVTVETTVAPTSTVGYSFCALTIRADNGATATTQRGKETFLPITPSSGVSDTPISGHYLLGPLNNISKFTLGSTGQTTITVWMGQGGSMVACTVPSGYLKMYVDVYK